jgi:hypothetical protein
VISIHFLNINVFAIAYVVSDLYFYTKHRYTMKDKKHAEELALIEQEMEAHQAHSRKVRDKKVLLDKTRGDLGLMEARLGDKISTTQLMDEPEDELRSR